MEGKFPGGVPETFSTGVKDISKAVRVSFPKGSYQSTQAFQGGRTWKIGFQRVTFGITTPPGMPEPNVNRTTKIAFHIHV